MISKHCKGFLFVFIVSLKEVLEELKGFGTFVAPKITCNLLIKTSIICWHQMPFKQLYFEILILRFNVTKVGYKGSAVPYQDLDNCPHINFLLFSFTSISINNMYRSYFSENNE